MVRARSCVIDNSTFRAKHPWHLDKECFTSMILAPNLVMQSLTVLEDHCATVKWITSSSGHSSPSAYLAQYEQWAITRMADVEKIRSYPSSLTKINQSFFLCDGCLYLTSRPDQWMWGRGNVVIIIIIIVKLKDQCPMPNHHYYHCHHYHHYHHYYHVLILPLVRTNECEVGGDVGEEGLPEPGRSHG